MKYTIEGLSQSVLLDLGLDCVDAVIIRWMMDFYHSGRMSKVNFQGIGEFFWMNYATAIKELPIIGIESKRAFAKRLDRMVECGLLYKHVVMQGGTYTYFAFSPEKIDSLTNKTDSVQNESPLYSKVQPPCTQKYNPPALKSTTKDSSISNSSIKDSEIGCLSQPTHQKTVSYKNYTEQQFIDECNAQSILDNSTLQSFIDYWTEKTASGKMRFQLEKTWETAKRMKKWLSNQRQWSKTAKADKNAPYICEGAEDAYKGIV